MNQTCFKCRCITEEPLHLGDADFSDGRSTRLWLCTDCKEAWFRDMGKYMDELLIHGHTRIGDTELRVTE